MCDSRIAWAGNEYLVDLCSNYIDNRLNKLLCYVIYTQPEWKKNLKWDAQITGFSYMTVSMLISHFFVSKHLKFIAIVHPNSSETVEYSHFKYFYFLFETEWVVYYSLFLEIVWDWMSSLIKKKWDFSRPVD